MQNKETLFRNKETLFRIKNLSQISDFKIVMITCIFAVTWFIYFIFSLIYFPDSPKATEALIHRARTVMVLQKEGPVQEK